MSDVKKTRRITAAQVATIESFLVRAPIPCTQDLVDALNRERAAARLPQIGLEDLRAAKMYPVRSHFPIAPLDETVRFRTSSRIQD